MEEGNEFGILIQEDLMISNKQISKPTSKSISKNTVCMFLTYFFSSLGAYIFDIGIIVELYKISGSTIAVGGFFIVQFIPSLILTPIAGALIDRLNQKYILLFVNILRGAAVALLLVHLSIETIYIVAVILGICDETSSSTISSIIPQTTPSEDISKINSVLSTTDSVNMIFGPAIAGLLITLAGINGSISAVIFTFILAGLMILFIEYKYEKAVIEKSKHFITEIKEGLEIVTKSKLVKKIILIWGFLLIGIGATGSLIVIMLSDYMHLPTESYGWIMTAEGIGLVIGSVLIIRKKKPYHHYDLIVVGMILLGVSLMITSFADNLFVVLGAYLLVGLGAASAPNGIRTTLQTELPKEILGRVFTTTRFIINTLRTLSIAIASILSKFMSLRIIFFIAACFILYGAFSSRGLKRLERV
ncbi:MFS transporter [Paenibacillus sonchi]|uniref:MFS transporter n=2 Tax=Paenibacillus sonchi TaxID=373687 RepID=A0A974PH86_9BACL|nr:MFS transporter [Paenibacillus sonchi]